MRAQLGCLLTLTLLGCPGGGSSSRTPDGPTPPNADGEGAASGKATVIASLEEAPEGEPFQLGEAAPPNGAWTPIPQADAEPLGEAATQALLARLPDLPQTDRQDFARRQGPPPPPRSGEDVQVAFPPPANPPVEEAAPAGPLTVLRHQPDGDVPLVPHLSLTFSQPMVPVGSVADVAAAKVPVTLTPQPAGRWRWLGTRTLTFEPEGGRFPMATAYRVEVPAGTASASGGASTEAFGFGFRTPPAQVLSAGPQGGPLGLEPTLHVTFDQRVDPAAVLKTIRVTAGQSPVTVRLATADEAEVLDLREQRSVAFRPQQPLPPGTGITVRVGPGTPSAEGPRVTEGPHTWTFHTYGPFKVTSHRAGWGRACPPGAPFQIQFSNPIDPEAFDPAQLTLSPEVPGLQVHAYGNTLMLRGATRANTTYTATLDPKLRDAFGQALGQSEPLEFKTTAPQARLMGIGQEIVILDPAAKPRVTFRSIAVDEVRIRLFALEPKAGFPAYRQWRGRMYGERKQALPGRLVSDQTLAIAGDGEAWVETAVDLAPALKDGLGHTVVWVESTERPEHGWPQHVVVWTQATKLGVDAQSDGGDLLAWVTRLEDGAPVHDAEVELVGQPAVRTDDAGLARLPLRRLSQVLIARKGQDSVLLPGYWNQNQLGVQLRWFTFDDRHLYRPKETVRVKGWVRRWDPGKGGDLLGLGNTRVPRDYAVYDANGQEIGKGQIHLDAMGGFDLSVEIPDTTHVGQARIQFGGAHTHTFRIAEFRRPEFEVTAATAEPGPHVAGERVVVTAAARYFAGGGLPNAPVTWTVEARPGHYTPPNRGDYAFGEHVPWWVWNPGFHGAQTLHTASFQGATDGKGEHHLAVRLGRRDTPLSLTASASVQDVNRQAWTAASAMLVQPAAHTVGLRLEQPFVRAGDALGVDVLVVDLDGEALPQRTVQLAFERVSWRWTRDGYEQEVAEQSTQTLTSAGEEPVRATLAKPTGGLWRVIAVVQDDQGRRSRTVTQVWVAGGKGPSTQAVEEERVTLVPDQETYAHGETAEVLVIAPFTPAEGLLTLRRSGIVKTQRFRMTEPTTVLKVAIDDAMVPNVHAHVALVGAAPRDGVDTKRPAFAAGSVDLKIPPRRRTLELAVSPAATELAPGAETSLEVVVTDFEGRPVRDAQVAVAVVDEAVLFLAGHARPDPLSVFYPPRQPGVQDARVRAFLRLEQPEYLEESAEELDDAADGAGMEMQRGGAPPMAPGAANFGIGGGGAGQQAPAPIDLREDLRALAVFSPSVTTDGEGRARVSYTLPDSLTRYRIVAVAAAGDTSFGAEEATLTARLPLMVRPSLPRFLNFGDRCELPVVIQNQTGEPLEVEIALRATETLAFKQGQGYSLSVPAHDRREVRFAATAQNAGTAHVQVAVAAGAFVDAQSLQLPVWTPATSEAFATYGVLDGDATLAQPIAPPAAYPQFGGLEITTSSTGLQALTDAVIYLAAYPYGCSEQIASRVLALAAIRDVLEAFDAEGLPTESAMRESVAGDLERLKQLQNPSDGGWGFWQPDRARPSWPYLTIHVVHALRVAQLKGFQVPAAPLKRGHDYLRAIERHIPAWYSEGSRRALIAYALYVRAKLGDADPKRAARLLADAGLEGLSLEALGWIYPTLRKAQDEGAPTIRRFLANRVVETAGAANFSTSYSDGAHVLLHSARRVDGVLLEALLDDPQEAQGELAPKLVQGLLAHRKRGRWSNTQENAFILLALDRYFRTAEAITPDFVARAWLGDAFAGEHAFRGRTTERAHVNVPMTWLQDNAGTPRLTLAKEGPGRLYYRIGLRYAPMDLELEPLDAGFTVQRRYEAVDDPQDVSQDEDGVWHVKAGARVRVRLTMLAPSRRYHVALVDPLPAGLEPLDPALPATGALPADPGSSGRGGCWWWTRTWYEHSGLRDERAEAFTSLLWEGVHTFSYVARATTPGTFVVPPTKAEEMYAPETFGRTGTDFLVVE